MIVPNFDTQAPNVPPGGFVPGKMMHRLRLGT